MDCLYGDAHYAYRLLLLHIQVCWLVSTNRTTKRNQKPSEFHEHKGTKILAKPVKWGKQYSQKQWILGQKSFKSPATKELKELLFAPGVYILNSPSLFSIMGPQSNLPYLMNRILNMLNNFSRNYPRQQKAKRSFIHHPIKTVNLPFEQVFLLP